MKNIYWKTYTYIRPFKEKMSTFKYSINYDSPEPDVILNLLTICLINRYIFLVCTWNLFSLMF